MKQNEGLKSTYSVVHKTVISTKGALKKGVCIFIIKNN